MLYNELFSNEFDTQVLRKKLAKAIGLNEAIVLNQLHYWIEKNKRSKHNFYDGKYWAYNTYEGWQIQDFEYWSVDTIKRTFTKLEKSGLVISGNYNKMPMDRTKWYTIDYEKMEELAIKISETLEKSTIRAKCTDGKGQSALSYNHRITIPKNNEYNSATKSHECDFSSEVIKKLKGLTDDVMIICSVDYYMSKFSCEMLNEHPNISVATLTRYIETVNSLLQDNIDEVRSDDGLIKMIDRHFDTNYGKTIDYKFPHFATEGILLFQARNCGYIDGYRE